MEYIPGQGLCPLESNPESTAAQRPALTKLAAECHATNPNNGAHGGQEPMARGDMPEDEAVARREYYRSLGLNKAARHGSLPIPCGGCKAAARCVRTRSVRGLNPL